MLTPNVSSNNVAGKTMYQRFQEKDKKGMARLAAKKYKTTIDSDAVNALLHAQLDKINGGSVSSKGTKEEQMDKKMNKLQSLLAAKTINDGQYEKMMEKLLENYVHFD